MQLGFLFLFFYIVIIIEVLMQLPLATSMLATGLTFDRYSLNFQILLLTFVTVPSLWRPDPSNFGIEAVMTSNY